MNTFNLVLPVGLRVIRAAPLPPKSPSLMAEINAAEYELTAQDREITHIISKIKSVLEVDSRIVERQTKKGYVRWTSVHFFMR